MAAFLDQGAAGFGVEPVPVTDLLQEGKPMLADGQHADSAGGRLRLFQEGGNGRHVAVFHRHPGQGRVGRGEGRNPVGIVRCGVEGFFYKNGQRAGARDLVQLVDMQVVGRGDQQRIHRLDRQQIGNGLDHLQSRHQGARGGLHPRIGLANGHHLGPVHQADIADMFLPHHAAADDAIAQVGLHVFYLVRAT